MVRSNALTKLTCSQADVADESLISIKVYDHSTITQQRQKYYQKILISQYSIILYIRN
jgi:hypothetical protein